MSLITLLCLVVPSFDAPFSDDTFWVVVNVSQLLIGCPIDRRRLLGGDPSYEHVPLPGIL